MDEHDDTEEARSAQARAGGEGVRIIGPEEAAAALETGQAAGRQPDDAPRFGDVPPPPAGPRPVHRFPLPDSVDPAEAVPRPPVATDPDAGRRSPGTAWAAPGDDPGAPAVGNGGAGPDSGGDSPFQPGPAQGPQGRPEDDETTWLAAEPRAGFRRRPGRGLFGAGRAGRHAGSRTEGAGASPVEGSWVDELTWSGSPVAARTEPDRSGTEAEEPERADRGMEWSAGGGGTATSGVELPHWSDPPTGEVPVIRPTTPPGAVPLVSPEPPGDDDLRAWSDLPRPSATWRDRQTDWDDLGYEPAQLGGDEARLGALDESREDPEDQYSFASLEPPENPRAPWGPQDPTVEDLLGDGGAGPAGDEGHLAGDVAGARGEPGGGVVRLGRGGSRAGSQPASSGSSPAGREPGGWARIATGVGIGVLALIVFAVGPVATLALAVTVVTLAASELFAVLRRAGYRPATLLGLVGTIGIMVAAYLKGESGLAVVLAVFAVAALLWFLAGVERTRPTVNLAATMLGFVWVGFLGAYAALLVSPSLFPHRHGIAFILGAAVATVAYDVGALVVGSRFGRRPLAPTISPNKTWEGTAGGVVTCLVVTVAVVGQIHPWGHAAALALAVLVCVVAPLGDLCESMVKRDLGIKDMGSLLPGHGGVLDRMDAMLFVMPATFYLVRVLRIG